MFKVTLIALLVLVLAAPASAQFKATSIVASTSVTSSGTLGWSSTLSQNGTVRVDASGNGAFAGLTATTGVFTSTVQVSSMDLTSTSVALGLNKVAGTPGGAAEGDLWYDDTANKVGYYDNAGAKALVAVGGAGTVQTVQNVSMAGGVLTTTVPLATAFSNNVYTAIVNVGSDDYVLSHVTTLRTTSFDVAFEANPDGLTFNAIAGK